jgi:hypothetical protein
MADRPGRIIGKGLVELTAEDGRAIQDIEPSTSDLTSTAHAQDVPALKVVHPSVLAECLRRGLWALARFFLPWAFLEKAIRAEGLGRQDRVTCLAVAFLVLPLLGFASC